MNISQPVASAIDSVDFAFLTPDEVKAVSVKKIENPTTFDSLLNPTPGGLYDTALGAWAEHLCSTCKLGKMSCPGHAGHIELPVPVYHPIFMDQVMRLLRAQCRDCHRFKMRRADLSLYICKFRLLQYNLIEDANHLDEITLKPKKAKSKPGEEDNSVPTANVIDDDEDEGDGKDVAIEKVVADRLAYTENALQRRWLGTADIRRGKHEAASEARRNLSKEFLKDMVTSRKCSTCGGVSPSYRKDRFVKIFEKAISVKDEAKMAQLGLKRRDAITIRQKDKIAVNKKKDHETDEGIADVDIPSDGEIDQEEAEASDEGDGEELDENGDVVMTDAPTTASSKTKTKKTPAATHKYITTLEIQSRLKLLFEKEQEIMWLLYNAKPQTKQSKPPTADSFFLQTILIPPNKYRPEARQGDGAIAESPQNSLYQKILEASSRVVQFHREIIEASKSGAEWTGRKRDIAEFHEACVQLQDCVNSLIDRDRNPIRGAAAKRLEDGIKQKLEKKEGLFRKNMMGKRVNFAARSVISPDPNIETSEIGVPPVFAKKLTYPEPVTSHNFREMQQAVINGPDKWPGAAAIEDENGQITHLSRKTAEDRVALANQLLAPTNHNQSLVKGKKVHRHIGNGDVVLMNRQPTLHKPSIMGHRVRVLPAERTIRMHYANCNTYNADFDGDEMNMHFPQNELARTEAMMIADTDHQYLSYTAGKPLRGLIQDHLSVSVALCNKDTFFDKGAYQQLVYNALRPEHGQITTERLELVPPTILKPVRRWTGKQVITTILKNIKPAGFGDLWLSNKTQIPANRWESGPEEGMVLFQNGQFIHGILDKAHLGPASGGFIHAIHETWGPESAAKLLSAMGRLLTRYLSMRAFTCGMDDLRLTPEGEQRRKETLESASKVGLKVSAKYVGLDENFNVETTDPVLLERLESVFRNDTEQEGLEALLNSECNQVSGAVTAACLPSGLEKQFPNNQMQSMTTSGAKGSSVNANLISCNLGQQVLEGRRVPLMVSGKSLPCFRPFETNVRAGGYIVNRFLTGIRTQEYYFHHMAGREGLIDTAVKTSRSGYLQRCLIKGMEGLKVAYDTSVRDSDGSMVQFLYGEDGQDITKQKYLHDFGFVLRNLESEVTQLGFDDRGWDQDIFSSKEYAQKYMKRAVKEAKANDERARDPIITELNPNRNAFATSESFYEKVTEYIKSNKDGLLRDKGDKSKAAEGISRKYAEFVFHTKYLNSLAEPGEAVGIVAGQSIGEPSTQMTLNTFHLAGHSAKNVTLGIPRLREILMTASNHISTPSMTLVLNEELPEASARQFAKGISKLPLAHVTDQVTVKERVGKGISYPLAKIFDVHLAFFRSSDYSETYAIEISDVLSAVEKKFLPLLQKLIKTEIKTRRGGGDSAAVPEIGVKAGNVEMAAPGGEREARDDDDDDDDNDGGDGDATSAKQRGNRAEAVSYGPNDEDDDEIQKRMEREASSSEDEDSAPEDEGFGGSPAPEDDIEDDKKTSKTEREGRVVGDIDFVSRFDCDEGNGEWCDFTMEFDASTPKLLMLNLVRSAVKKTLIQQIKGVDECTYVADEMMRDVRTGNSKKTAVVHTKGVNLVAMQKYGDYINPNRTQTNDIAAVLCVYGVEAARRNIMMELNNVFSSHSISVDNRHLNLIADYMTRSGGFTPFNRTGLSGNVSPFTKMSFETTLAFLKDAVLDGDWDDLRTPSSRIVLGKLSSVGTGAFDVLTRVHAKNGTARF